MRNHPDGRQLTMARWGMPSPAIALEGKKCDPGVTNVRNTKFSHWRRWLGVESRGVVPFTSFAENEVLPDGSRPPIWFALDETRPLAFFAGIWTRWTSVRKVKESETTNDLFAFLTTEPNDVVGAFHPKAMPVILTTVAKIETWMTAPPAEALSLQRPLPNQLLRVVARGAKKDGDVWIDGSKPFWPISGTARFGIMRKVVLPPKNCSARRSPTLPAARFRCVDRRAAYS